MKHGKKYRESIKKIDREKLYTFEEAAALVKSVAFAKFDETVEISVKLTLKKSQSVRDTVVLPNQFSAQKRVLVFAKGEKAQEALDAGAAFVGDNDLIEKIRGGWMDFDVAVATPDMMKDVGRLGPILGRRGLMPNPKTQTITFSLKLYILHSHSRLRVKTRTVFSFLRQLGQLLQLLLHLGFLHMQAVLLQASVQGPSWYPSTSRSVRACLEAC